MAKKKKGKRSKNYKKKYKELKSKYKKLKLKLKKKSSVKKAPKRKNEQMLDRSLNYNVKNAISKIRKLNSVESINDFTNGENRVTVLRAIEGRKNAVNKK